MNAIESELNFIALCLTKWNNGVWRMPDPVIYKEYEQKYKNLIEERKKISISQTAQMLP